MRNKGALFFWFPRTLCVSHLTASLSAGPHVFLYLLHLTTHAGLHLPRLSCWAPAGRSRSLRPQSWLELYWPSPRAPAGCSGSLCPQAATAFPSVGLVVIIAAFGRHAGCGAPSALAVCGSSISSFVGALCPDSSLPQSTAPGSSSLPSALSRRPLCRLPVSVAVCGVESYSQSGFSLAAKFRASSLEASSLVGCRPPRGPSLDPRSGCGGLLDRVLHLVRVPKHVAVGYSLAKSGRSRSTMRAGLSAFRPTRVLLASCRRYCRPVLLSIHSPSCFLTSREIHLSKGPGRKCSPIPPFVTSRVMCSNGTRGGPPLWPDPPFCRGRIEVAMFSFIPCSLHAGSCRMCVFL